MPDAIRAAEAYMNEVETAQRVLKMMQQGPVSHYRGVASTIVYACFRQAIIWRRLERGLYEQPELLAELSTGPMDRLGFAKALADIPRQGTGPHFE